MKPEVLAQARRYYHHVLHGGTLRPDDVAFMVEVLEEAANKSKWVYLTEEEMLDIVDTYGMPLAEAIEAKLRGKNNCIL
jgi:hypothetical protein